MPLVRYRYRDAMDVEDIDDTINNLCDFLGDKYIVLDVWNSRHCHKIGAIIALQLCIVVCRLHFGYYGITRSHGAPLKSLSNVRIVLMP